MIEIIEIIEPEKYADSILSFLLHRYTSVTIETYNKIPKSDLVILNRFKISSFYYNFIFKNRRAFKIDLNTFNAVNKILINNLKDWGFWVSKGDHGLFAKHVRFIELSNINDREDICELLEALVESGTIGSFKLNGN